MSFQGIKAILFDLDDTLYNELDFYGSGFEALGELLERRGVGRRAVTAEMLLQLHQREGREQVLQKLALRLPFPSDWIPELVTAFRSHQPAITLPTDTCVVLPRLRAKYRLGCVTNGWAEVQRRKIAALKVASLLDVIVVADDLGRQFWKPHTLPFQKCCERLGVAPGDSVFVGDSPDHDMAGARNAGMKCVRMRRPGSYFENIDLGRKESEIVCEAADLHALERMLAGG